MSVIRVESATPDIPPIGDTETSLVTDVAGGGVVGDVVLPLHPAATQAAATSNPCT